MGWAFFFFDLQEGAPRPVLFEPVIGASRNTRLLPFDHRTTGARRGQGKCAESRQGETRQAGQAQGQRQQKHVGLSPFQMQLQGCIRAALKLAGPDLGIVVSSTTAHWGTMPAYRG